MTSQQLARRSLQTRLALAYASGIYAAGDVTGTPLMNRCSSAANASVWTTMPDGARRLAWMSSMGIWGSTHFAPSIADADKPETTPSRPDQSHAARAHSVSAGSTPRGAHTPGYIAK